MNQYETIFIAHPDCNETKIGEINQKFETILKKHGGKILKTEDWGTRRLAYVIRHQPKGHYIHHTFELKPEGLQELNRSMELREDILKQIIVRLEDK